MILLYMFDQYREKLQKFITNNFVLGFQYINGKLGFVGKGGNLTHSVEYTLNPVDSAIGQQPVMFQQGCDESLHIPWQLRKPAFNKVIKPLDIIGKIFIGIAIPEMRQIMIEQDIDDNSGILMISIGKPQFYSV